jgi:hypothetical protein
MRTISGFKTIFCVVAMIVIMAGQRYAGAAMRGEGGFSQPSKRCIGGLSLSYNSTGNFGTMFSFDLMAEYGPPYSCSIGSGVLPPGLSLDTAACKISGVPKDIGLYKVVVSAKDSCSADKSGTINFAVTVTCSGASCNGVPCTPLNIFSSGRADYPWLPKGFSDRPYSVQLFSGGRDAKVTKLTVAGSPDLPQGLRLDYVSGRITGTPTVYARGEYRLNFEVTDGCPWNSIPKKGTATLKIAETAPPQIKSFTVTPASVASSGGQVTLTVAATDNIAVFKVTSTLVWPDGQMTHGIVPLVSGTPADGQWVQKFTVGSNGNSTPQNYSLKVKAQDADGNVTESQPVSLTAAGHSSMPMPPPQQPKLPDIRPKR